MHAFFSAGMTGKGTLHEAMDEGEVHRLSRDSIRRRYEAERCERAHLEARDDFMNYVKGFVDQVRPGTT